MKWEVLYGEGALAPEVSSTEADQAALLVLKGQLYMGLACRLGGDADDPPGVYKGGGWWMVEGALSEKNIDLCLIIFAGGKSA